MNEEYIVEYITRRRQTQIEGATVAPIKIPPPTTKSRKHTHTRQDTQKNQFYCNPTNTKSNTNISLKKIFDLKQK